MDNIPELLDGGWGELNRGHMTLVARKNSNRGGALSTPHPHSLVQTTRSNHCVVTAKGHVRHLSTMAPQGGQELACAAGPHLHKIIVCTSDDALASVIKQHTEYRSQVAEDGPMLLQALVKLGTRNCISTKGG